MVKDAISLRELANNREIADTCVWLPHPCSKGLAQCWIWGAAEHYAAGTGAEFGIQLKSGGELFGVVGFDDRSVNNASAELGFLLNPRWWGKGYATEAVDLAVWYGFKCLKLNRIYAYYRVSNPASGRVLAKLGMKREGLMRQCVRKPKGFEDMVLMALLREEWEKLSQD
jgi:RimJ/RimL family protein N-acetyltransferase